MLKFTHRMEYDVQIFTDPIESVYQLIAANPVSLPREKIIGSTFSTSFFLIHGGMDVTRMPSRHKRVWLILHPAESSEKEELESLEKHGVTLQSEIDRLKGQIAKAEDELSQLVGAAS